MKNMCFVLFIIFALVGCKENGILKSKIIVLNTQIEYLKNEYNKAKIQINLLEKEKRNNIFQLLHTTKNNEDINYYDNTVYNLVGSKIFLYSLEFTPSSIQS